MKQLLLTILRAGTITVTAAGFSWGLYAYGAAETRELFRLFLIMLLPLSLLLVGLWNGRWEGGGPAAWLLLLWGAFQLWKVSFSPTLEARGYALFALGWMALLLTRSLGRSEAGQRRVLWFLLAVGVVEGLTGFSQALNPDWSGEASRIATGTLYNPSHFASLQNMLFSLGVGVLFALHFEPGLPHQFDSERMSRSWLLILVCSVAGVSVLLTRSRAGTLILILCIGLGYGLVQVSRRFHGRGSSAAPLLLVLGLTLGLGVLLGLDALLARFESADLSLAQRSQVYRDTLGLIAEHPLQGVGPMNYEWRFRPHQSATGRVWYDYAHNDYLQILAEWGIPLGVALWAFVFWRFFRCVRLFLDLGEVWARGVALGCALGIFSILCHSLVDFNLYVPSNHVVFCAILGLSWALDDAWGPAGSRGARW